MKNKFFKEIFLFWILIFLFLPIFFAFSQSKRILMIDWPRTPLGTSLDPCKFHPVGDECTFALVTRYLYEWAIFLGGVITFFALILAGIKYLTSFGDPAAVKEAQNRIFWAFLGLALLLGTWIILNTISSGLTELIPPQFPTSVVAVTVTPFPTPQPYESRKCDLAVVKRNPGGEIELVPHECIYLTEPMGTQTRIDTVGYVEFGNYTGPRSDIFFEVKSYLAGRGYIKYDKYVECSLNSFTDCQTKINEIIERETKEYEKKVETTDDPEALDEAGKAYREAMEATRETSARLCCSNCNGEIRVYGTSRPKFCEGLSENIGIGQRDFRDLRFDVYNIQLFVGKEYKK